MPKLRKDRLISDFMDLSTIPPEYRDIALEVGEAYADGLIEDYPEGMRRRSLDFHACPNLNSLATCDSSPLRCFKVSPASSVA